MADLQAIACKELKSTVVLTAGGTICGVFLGSAKIKILRPITKKGPQVNLKFSGEISVILHSAEIINHHWDVLHWNSLLRN